MKNEAKSTQIALLLLLVIPGGKMLSLPAIFAETAGKDSWFAIAILLLLDFICFLFLLWAISINKLELSLYEVLKKTITAVGAKIVMLLFFFFFVAKLLFLSTSVYDMFTLTFSIKMTWLVFVVTIFIFTVFMTVRGFKTIARLNEMLFVLILTALLIILISPLSDIDSDNLLPFLEDGFSPVVKSMLSGNIWFADYIFIYFVMDKIKLKEKLFASNVTCFVVASAITVLMNAMFVSLYGDMAENTHLAISRVSQYALVSSIKGRLDWISLWVWSMSTFIKLALFTFAAHRCLLHVFDLKSNSHVWVLVFVVAFFVLPLFVAVDDMTRFIVKYFSLPFAVVQYLLPLLLPLLVKLSQDRIIAQSHQLKKIIN